MEVESENGGSNRETMDITRKGKAIRRRPKQSSLENQRFGSEPFSLIVKCVPLFFLSLCRALKNSITTMMVHCSTCTCTSFLL